MRIKIIRGTDFLIFLRPYEHSAYNYSLTDSDFLGSDEEKKKDKKDKKKKDKKDKEKKSSKKEKKSKVEDDNHLEVSVVGGEDDEFGAEDDDEDTGPTEHVDDANAMGEFWLIL